MKRLLVAAIFALASTMAFAQTLPTPNVAGLKVNGTAQTFPASGNIVGTSDAQTLTNKSIGAGQLTGTLPSGLMPGLTGDCTASVGAVTLTCSTTNGVAILPTVSTISALKALSTTTAAAIGTVNVAGYYAAGDGGGGQFVWNGSSTSADNSCTIIDPSSAPPSGRWLRVLANPAVISAAQCGGFPSASDIGAYVTLAIAALPSTGGEVIVPGSATLYHMTSTVVIPSHVTVSGDGNGEGAGSQTGTSITWSGSDSAGRLWDMRNTSGATFQNIDFNTDDVFNGIVVDIGDATAGQVSSFATLQHLTLAANSAATSNSHCVWANRAIAWTIQYVNFSNCLVAVNGGTDTGSMQSTTGTIRKSHFVIPTSGAALECGGNNWNIDDDIFEPLLSTSTITVFGDCANIPWQGMYFSHIWIGDLGADGSTLFSLAHTGANFSIKDSQIAGHSVTSNIGINIPNTAAISGVVLENNYVEDLTELLSTAATTTGTIIGNTAASVTYCTGGGGSTTGMLKGGNAGFTNAC